jgi:hypothetical protein
MLRQWLFLPSLSVESLSIESPIQQHSAALIISAYRAAEVLIVTEGWHSRFYWLGATYEKMQCRGLGHMQGVGR